MIIVIILLGISLIIYFNLSEYLYQTKIYNVSIDSKVLNVKFKGRGGYQYFYNNGSFGSDYFSMERDVKYLNVGDSISKNKQSLILDTYKRSSNGTYVFYKRFIGF